MNNMEKEAYIIIENVVNCLAEKNYEILGSLIEIDESWSDEGADNAAECFAEWLEGQLEMWIEDYEKEIIIDFYDEKQVDPYAFSNGKAYYEYRPTSNGEPLDFWFEIEFSEDEEGNLSAVFNVNI
ncbi:MAG: hypothetical protein IKB01_11605 [Lachnospiraceae bacterium]|nr:hypothetical protein [Lachnospiraceae bacterium]MBR4082751.1 hypothetical protein [Lachnospiraceae bacterium]